MGIDSIAWGTGVGVAGAGGGVSDDGGVGVGAVLGAPHAVRADARVREVYMGIPAS